MRNRGHVPHIQSLTWLFLFNFFLSPRFPGVKLRLKQGRQLFTYLCDRLALYTISSSWVHAFSFSDFPWQWDGIGLIWNKPDYSLYVNAFVSNVLQSTEPGPIGNYSIKRRDWRAYLFVWYARLHLQSICFNAEDVCAAYIHTYICKRGREVKQYKVWIDYVGKTSGTNSWVIVILTPNHNVFRKLTK